MNEKERRNEMYERFLKESNYRTDILAKKMRQIDDLDRLIEDNRKEILNGKNKVGTYMADLLNKYDKASTVISERIGLNRSYINQIINGDKNNPSRDILICFCIEIGANEDELETLLKFSGYAPLYIRNERDLIIKFCMQNGYTLFETNEQITLRDHAPLYKDI